MRLSQIVYILIDLERNRCHNAQHVGYALHVKENAFRGPLFASDSRHKLAIQFQITLIAARLRRRERHRVHPVAQRRAVMPLLLQERPLGQLDLVLIDRRIRLRRIHAAFTEVALQHRLDHRIKRGTGTHGIRQRMIHAVTVIHDVEQQRRLTRLIGRVMLREAAVRDVLVEAVDVIVEVQTQMILGAVIQTPGVQHSIGTFAQTADFAFLAGNAAPDFIQPAGIAVLHHLPRNGVVFLLGQNLLEDAILVAEAELTTKVTVVAPQTQIVNDIRTMQGNDQRAVSLFLKVLVSLSIEILRNRAGRRTGIGYLARQALLGQHFTVILRIAANRAGRTATNLDNVLVDDLSVIVHELGVTIGNSVDIAHRLLAHIDRTIGRLAPNDTRRTLPTVFARSRVFCPRLWISRNIMIVVSADEFTQHIIAQFLMLDRIGNHDRTCSAHSNALEFLIAQRRTSTCTSNITDASHQAGKIDQILTSGTNRRHIEFRTALLCNHLIRIECTSAPDMGSILEGNLIVVDLEVDRRFAAAFDDDRIVASILHVLGEMAAHVRIDDGIAAAPGREQRDIGAASARHSRASQRAHAEDNLRRVAVGLGIHGHFVPEHLIADAHTSDVMLILGQRILEGDAAGGQIDAQDRTCPAVNAILCRHRYSFLSRQIA